MTLLFQVFVSVLLFLVMHVAFLIAISFRLGRIGYAGSTILKMNIIALGSWPVVFIAGFCFGLPALYYYSGVPAIIAVNMLAWIIMEMRIMLERPDETSQRTRHLELEEERHRAEVDADALVLSRMVAVKSYVGDDSQLSAISDLAKLKSANIRCRVEGSLVKTIFVHPEDMEGSAKILDVAVETDPGGDVRSG